MRNRAALRQPRIQSGGSPRRQHPVFQQGWNRKGLISETGARKQAFYVLAEEYRRRAGSAR